MVKPVGDVTLSELRKALLETLGAVKAQQARTYLHLLYTPELADPLELIGNTQRDTAMILPPAGNYAALPEQTKHPRLITLDCRRIAAWLLENDPALDDPLFEASMTQAHAEICLHQAHDVELTNDEREFTATSISGWLYSDQTAPELAKRLRDFSARTQLKQQYDWVRWTNPLYLNALWTALNDTEQYALLGDAVWFSFNTLGQLNCYQADSQRAQANDHRFIFAGDRLSQHQQRIYQNIPIVRDLLPRWQQLCQQHGQTLPNDAEQQLHAYIQQAQDAALDPDSVVIYTLTAIQLKPGATHDPAWLELMHNVAQQGMLLRDQLQQLPDPFWERWSLPQAHLEEDEWNSASP